MVPDQSMGPSVLLIDDSRAFRRSLARALDSSYNMRLASSAEEALTVLEPPPDAVLLDLRLREDDETNAEALSLLQQFRGEIPQVPVIMITAYGDVETAVECMRLGAADFIQKGGDIRELRVRIEKALETARVSARLRRIEEELAIVEPRRLIGASAALREVKEMIAGVAHDAKVSVLISGETGTGKELVARSIHASGPRSGHPFVGVALAALPSSTAEAELFGYEPGAFTDARRRHMGLIERAHGGVLFLDEIGELRPDVQVKLLRFLEERVIVRLGGQREISVDVQVVAATNANLPSLIEAERFRKDLFYRLRVCEIRLPPLRERREDIVPLVKYYLAKLGGDKGIVSASKPALAAVLSFCWPGNVRELRNALETAVLKANLHGHRIVEREDLPEEVQVGQVRGIRRVSSKWGGTAEISSPTLDEVLARAELECVEDALQRTDGKKTKAWKLLGLNDRFVFARRVRRLCDRFPKLIPEFPFVQTTFCGQGKRLPPSA